MDPAAKWTLLVCIVLALVFNIIAFVLRNKNNGFDSFSKGLGTLILWILGFPGSLVGTIVRNNRRKRAEEEDRLRKEQERKEQEKEQEEEEKRLHALGVRIRKNPALHTIAKVLTAPRPLVDLLIVGTDCVGHVNYHDYGMANLPSEKECREMAYALAETEELKGRYRVEYDRCDGYMLVLSDSNFSEW